MRATADATQCARPVGIEASPEQRGAQVLPEKPFAFESLWRNSVRDADRALTGIKARPEKPVDLLSEQEERSMKARGVMTKGVVAVTGETELAEIADLLERRRIKRVPVVSAPVRRRIIAESAKDLMKIPHAELGAHLAGIVAEAKPPA